MYFRRTELVTCVLLFIHGCQCDDVNTPVYNPVWYKRTIRKRLSVHESHIKGNRSEGGAGHEKRLSNQIYKKFPGLTPQKKTPSVVKNLRVNAVERNSALRLSTRIKNGKIEVFINHNRSICQLPANKHKS